MKTFEFKPLRGKETEILLENPDRGFRMETKMEVSGKEGLFSYDPNVLKNIRRTDPLLPSIIFILPTTKKRI